MQRLALNSPENYIRYSRSEFVAGYWKGEDCLSDLGESDFLHAHI